jgi:hypothetical protein
VNKKNLKFLRHTSIPFILSKSFFSLLSKSNLQNLSFHNLSTDHSLNQSDSLGLGAKFCPRAPDSSAKTLSRCFDSFRRNLALKIHFAFSSSTTINRNWNPIFHVKGSTWWPTSLPAFSTQWLHLIKSTLDSIVNHHIPRIIPSFHASNLQKIKTRGDLKVINSDKNLGICVLDTQDYDNMVKRHLTDLNHYRPVGSINDSSYLDPILLAFNNFIQKASKVITNQERKYLESSGSQLPAFHCLIKLHKGTPYNGRPIIGAVNWITTKVSVWAGYHLSRIKCQSVLKDSFHFIQEIENQIIPQGSYLVTMDISSLYTNISLPRLYQVINKHQCHPLLTEAIQFICGNNYFFYNKGVFQQVDGIAMGTNCAPILANLYLSEDFDPFFRNHVEISRYRRFLDDVFFIWTPSHGSTFEDLKNQASAIIPGIKVTGHHHHQSISFLDCNVFIHDNMLKIKPFQKDLNKFSYLPPFSYHPTACIKGFIKAELIRYVRLSSFVNDYHDIALKFKTRLIARGFTTDFLAPIFHSVDHSQRGNYLERQVETIPTLPIVVPYQDHPSIKRIKDQMGIMQHAINECFPGMNSFTLRITFKKRPSVLSLTSKSGLTTQQQEFLNQGSHIISKDFSYSQYG